MRKRILIVDDEPDLLELVSYTLRKEGHETVTALEGIGALEKLRRDPFDLLILDLMLPGIGGIEICRRLRDHPRTSSLPVIMLTAKGDVSDKVAGLNVGADDYMTKPFSPRELSARVSALLRRADVSRAADNNPEDEASVGPPVSLGPVLIDPATCRAACGGELVELSATEFKLLLYLARRKGRVFSRDQLLDAVWSDEAFVEPRTVDVHISRLRAKIETDPARPALIRTRRGLGYFATDE
ncbi:MAG: response regulator transcription factor [Nitrospirae bacterium]|nr:response regulator transcription factor [Nitrospirota bacterium]